MISPYQSNFSNLLKVPIRRAGRTAVILGAAAALVLSLAAAHAASASKVAHASGFHFRMVRTPGVTCLPHASANVTIVRGAQNDTMTVSVSGLPAKTGFDLRDPDSEQALRSRVVPV